MTFEEELAHLIHQHSKEDQSNTPDLILLRYVEKCLEAYTATIQHRDTWLGQFHNRREGDKK